MRRRHFLSLYSILLSALIIGCSPTTAGPDGNLRNSGSANSIDLSQSAKAVLAIARPSNGGAETEKTPSSGRRGHLADPNWVADPVNYQVTTNVVENRFISVPILEYHEANYVPGDIATLKPGQFASELKWLHEHGFHTINFGQLYAAMYHGYRLPQRPVLLTFDDGYESVYFKAFPLLKQYHDQATLFIVGQFTHVKPNRNKPFPTLTVGELQEMQASGLVDIEDHTMTHRDLSTLSPEEQTREIDGDAQFLQRIVHHPIKFFCYPDGGYTPETLMILKNGGFLLAVTQHQGYANLSQGPFTLHRITILSTTTLHDFAVRLSPSLH